MYASHNKGIRIWIQHVKHNENSNIHQDIDGPGIKKRTFFFLYFFKSESLFCRIILCFPLPFVSFRSLFHVVFCCCCWRLPEINVTHLVSSCLALILIRANDMYLGYLVPNHGWTIATNTDWCIGASAQGYGLCSWNGRRWYGGDGHVAAAKTINSIHVTI